MTILVLMLAVLLILIGSVCLAEEVTLKDDTTKGYIVKELPPGLVVVLKADVAVEMVWTKNFTFDIDYDWKDESSYATTGLWFGNGITSYWFTYARNVQMKDPGRASFSFSWMF